MSFGTVEVATTPAEQAKWKQVHALALSIYQSQQRVNANRKAGDLLQAQRELGVVTQLRGYMASKLAEIEEMTGDDLTAMDRFIIAVDTWVRATIAAIPGAIAAIPIAILDGIKRIAAKAGGLAVEAVFPWALLAVGVVAVLLFAEKSRIVRRLV